MQCQQTRGACPSGRPWSTAANPPPHRPRRQLDDPSSMYAFARPDTAPPSPPPPPAEYSVRQ